MRTVALPLAFLLLAAARVAADDSCVQCHRGLPGKPGEAVRLSENDIHFRRGLSCASCHGGDGSAATKEAAHDPDRGYGGPPRGRALLDACGRCHSDPAYMKGFNPSSRVDQVAQYLTSVHGKKLLEGDEKVATCVSCHGNHGILPVKDPSSPVFPSHVPDTCGRCHGDPKTMEGRKIPTDIPDKYRGSVHGRALLERGDLAAPACNSCHGNHGAAPPDTSAVANVCGICHAQQATLFRATAKKRFFDSGGTPECAACHSEHDIRPPSDAMLTLAEGSSCVECHEDPEDAARKGTVELALAFGALAGRIDSASAVLERAEHAGMEVSGPIYRLSEALDRLTEARVLVHSFDVKRVLEKIREGETIAVEQQGEGEQALAEIDYRKRGLYLSLGAIALVVIGLWMKIREVDRRYPPSDLPE